MTCFDHDHLSGFTILIDVVYRKLNGQEVVVLSEVIEVRTICVECQDARTVREGSEVFAAQTQGEAIEERCLL